MKKRFTFLIAALMLLTMINLPGKVVGQITTFASGSGTSNYSVPEGWTISGTVVGGSYLKFDNGTLTSPEFAPHNEISFTYSVATLNSGTNHPLTIRILNASTNAVIKEETTATPTSSSYINTDSPISLGDVNVAFKIQLYAPSDKGIRLRNYSITGTPAVIATHTAYFSVNESITSQDFAEGAAITFPDDPDDINGKSFVGWSETTISGTTNTAPDFVTSATMGNSDVTFYAVFATVTPGSATIVTDELDRSTTGVTGTSYTNWSGKTATSDAVYAGNSAGGNSSIQLRSDNNNSGVVTTTSGGKAKKVTITWNDNTSNGRTLNVYGKNSAYSQATDLYNNSNQGTLLGTVVKGTSGELTVSGDYEYIGLRSNSGAMYITTISIDWQTGTPDTYSDYCTTVDAVIVERPVITVAENPFLFSTTATITCATDGAAIKYSYNGENWIDYSAALTITATTTIYAKGVKGGDESSVAQVTATKNLAEPTVTIDASALTTNDISGNTNVSAGTLSASVTYNDAAVAGATVTWSSSNTSVATVNASGEVTLIAIGETTITAAYLGNGDYAAASDTYALTVINSHAPGQVNNPYSVAQAMANTPSSGDVYIHGIVSSFYNTSIVGDGSNYRYYISDDGTTTNQLLVYKGKGLNNVAFSNVDDLLIGDEVTIYGTLITFSNAPEIAANNYIVVRKIVTPSFSPAAGGVASGTTVTISTLTTGATIYYTTDGTEPTTGSSHYSTPIEITGTTTLKSFATKDGYTNSDIATASYTVLPPAATPSFSPAAGTYTWAQNVTISTATVDATIYYTTDGTNPTTSSTVYSEAIVVDETMTIKAIAAKDGMANSAVAEATYTMNIPSISAANVNLTYDATSGSITYSITNAVEGGMLTAAINEGSTIVNLAIGTIENNTVALTCSANNGETDRTATVTLTYTYSDTHTVTKQVTVTQAHLIVDYATLPFEWEGGTSAELTAVVGVTANGLGTDYAESNAPYRVKFDTNGDNIIIKTNEQPGVVTIGLKKFGSGNTTIKVQGSVDGEAFSDVETLTFDISQNNTQTLSTQNSFNANVRYVRIIRNSGANVGVGPISIAKPKYAITLNSPTTGGTFTADKATAAEGETVTLTPEASEHYAFTSWTVCKTGEPSTTVNVDNNQFEMPAYPVTVSATFTETTPHAITVPSNVTVNAVNDQAYLGDVVTITVAAPEDEFLTSLTVTGNTTSNLITLSPEVSSEIYEYTFTMPDEDVTIAATFAGEFTVQFSVNGESAGSQNVTAGQSVTLSSQEPPTGFIFAGWTINQTNFDNIITGDSYTPTADVTLYAVYSKTITGAPVEHVVILDGEATGLSSTLLSSETTISENGFSYKAIGVKYTNVQSNATNAFVPENKTILGGKDASVCIYNSTAFGDGITKFEIYENYGASASVTVGVNFGVNQITSYNAGSSNTWSQAIVPNTVYDASSALPEGAKYFCFGITKDKNAQVQFRITYTTISSTTEYYTRVQSIAGTTTEISTVTPADLITVPAGAVLTITGACTGGPENLIIKDGGQLIIPDNTKVKATVQKATAGSSAEKTEANNLYAISSPVDGIKISSFAQGTHNVYQYYEPTSTWQEYRNASNEFDNLAIGRGYLYRSSVENIELAGDVTGGDKNGEVKYTLSYAYGVAKYKGLNLVGNPFTHDITWSDLTLENVESSGCYMLVEDPAVNDHGKWKAVLAASVTVKPMQAFFVQATSADASITFNNSAAKGINYANDNIMFSVKNSKCSDEAYVMFAEGHGLNKIEHRNSEIPMLYIMNNGQNYAIADMSDDTEVINIGFEAKTMGQYTFSIKTEGQYSYMHLVDKLTGEDVDMLVEDSYTFVGAPNDRKDRFVLNLNYNAANINTDSDIFAYQSGSDIIIRGDGELHVFDVMGRLVLTQRVNGVETISMQSQGVYIFKLNGMTQKIVVK